MKLQNKAFHLIERVQSYQRGEENIVIEWFYCGRHFIKGSGPKLICTKKCKRCFSKSRVGN